MSAGLPPGRYVSCFHDLRPDQAGTMRALLTRTRIFAERGADTAVLTFAPAADLAERRAAFRSSGLMPEPISLLSIFEHYREHGWRDEQATSRPLRDLSRHRVGEELQSDGTLFRTTYLAPASRQRIHDYHRADGTVFLRMPSFTFQEPRSWPRNIVKVSPDGTACGTFERLGQWCRAWIRELGEGAERTFVFIDARQMVPHLVPMRDPDVHLLYVLHNNHLRPPRRWDSPIAPDYQRVLDRMQHLDAFVCLTARQREDIGLRRGETTNLFVVPNRVEPPQEQDGRPRDPRRATVLARLEPQKRLDHAIQAFEQVVRRVPDARLEAFGAGRLRDKLQREIDRRGLTASVTLRGQDPHAAESLWESSVFVLTSTHEGHPVATLESLARGCPVVAYDVKYGPREQIVDGVDGFLVEDGRVDEVADRVVRLLRDPELVARMSEAARAKAVTEGLDRFVSDWQSVLSAVVADAPRRTTLRGTRLTIRRLSVGQVRRIGRSAERVAPVGSYPPDEVLVVEGVLDVQGQGTQGLDDAELSLIAVGAATGHRSRLPVTVRRRGRRLHFHAEARLADALPPAGPAEAVRLTLRLVWRNSARDHVVAAPGGSRDDSVTVGYDLDGAVVLTRFGANGP